VAAFEVKHRIIDISVGFLLRRLMEELHTDSIDGGSEAIYRLGHVPG
jgi:hypothetical protein